MDIMLNNMKHLLALVIVVLTASVSFAQQSPTLVTFTATPNAQPNLLCSQALAINTQATCTVNPSGTQSVYVTAVYFDVCTTAAPTAQNNVSFTLLGPPGLSSATAVWQFSVPASATVQCSHWGDNLGGPGAVLMKTASGTSLTVQSPAASATNGYGIRVYGYLAQ